MRLWSNRLSVYIRDTWELFPFPLHLSRIQQEGSYLQVKKKALPETEAAGTLIDHHPFSCSPSPNHPCSLPQHKLPPSVLTTWEPPVLIRWETFNCKLNVLKQTDKQYWVFHFLSQSWKVQEYMASGQFDPGAHILSLKICPSQLYILMTVVLNFDCGTWLSRLLSPF